MRVVSWNVNGIRACVRHGFVDFVDRSGTDIVSVQEVRARPEDIPPTARRPPVWHTAFTVVERRGYSGVGLYSKLQPVRVDTSLGVPRFDREGRFMAAHFQTACGRFVVVNGYFPKGSGPDRDNSRVGYKLDFSRTVFTRAQALRRRGPVLVIGDYNTAHRSVRETTRDSTTSSCHDRPPPARLDADVQRRERLGGLLSFYYREAA